MKKLLISTSLAITLGLPAVAAETRDMFRSAAGPSEFHASSFIGKRIYQTETDSTLDLMDGVQDGWSDIGEVNDVILSRDGTTEAVLVDIGGFLGVGENQIAVDMEALKFVRDGNAEQGADGYFLVLNAPKEALEAAPAYDTSGRVDAQSDIGAEGSVDATALTRDSELADIEATADRVVGNIAEVLAPEPSAEDRLASDAMTADALTGAPTFDANDKMIGEVSDIVMDGDGDVNAVIVDVGGFLGLGAKPVALQLGDVSIKDQEGQLRLYTMMTEAQMSAMPAYQPG